MNLSVNVSATDKKAAMSAIDSQLYDQFNPASTPPTNESRADRDAREERLAEQAKNPKYEPRKEHPLYDEWNLLRTLIMAKLDKIPERKGNHYEIYATFGGFTCDVLTRFTADGTETSMGPHTGSIGEPRANIPSTAKGQPASTPGHLPQPVVHGNPNAPAHDLRS